MLPAPRLRAAVVKDSCVAEDGAQELVDTELREEKDTVEPGGLCGGSGTSVGSTFGVKERAERVDALEDALLIGPGA